MRHSMYYNEEGGHMVIFCSGCGEECAVDAKFCPTCGHSLDGEAANTQGGSVFAILGWVFSGISILFFPILFAGGGVIFGYLHRKVNETHGTIIIIGAIACGLFGMVLGAALAGYQLQSLNTW